MRLTLARRLISRLIWRCSAVGGIHEWSFSCSWGDHAGDELGIDAIGLAAKPHRLGIVTSVLGIEHVDHEAALVRKFGEQFVIDPSRFHADATARGQVLEEGEQRSALVVDLARGEACFGAGHRHLVLTDIGTDIERYGWGLHGVSPVIYDCGCWGGTPTGGGLWSNRRSHAARFFIDAGWCGWGSSDRVCPSAEGRCRSRPLHPGFFTVEEDSRKHQRFAQQLRA